jgi:nicotinamidase/pyrazinamidase
MSNPDHEALVVIDVQNDFCTGGALAVPGGEEVVPVINRLATGFRHVVMTQDWHPAGHFSFASSHPGKEAFTAIDADYGTQTLWPDHCVQATDGAAFHAALNIPHAAMVVRKGMNPALDSYSAFYENDHATPTGLAGYLRDRKIGKLVMAGLATDFCVAWSAIDAAREGFDVTVHMAGCRAIDLDGSLASSIADMQAAGVTLA